MTLIPTDFTCPVAPAISRWGIFVRSTMNVSILIVLPIAMGSSISDSIYFLEDKRDFIDTTDFFLFGTSIPIVPFPGIGAIILIPRAERDNAISSSRFLIFEILTPASGIISYRVTVGPIVALIC